MARFLYESDRTTYIAVLHLIHNETIGVIDNPGGSTYRRMLAEMCINNHFDGFRLFVEQGVNLHAAQIACAEFQLNSLDACILICSQHHQNYEFVKVLLQHNIKTYDVTMTLPDYYIQTANKIIKTNKATNIALPLSQDEQKPSECGNSLLFCIRATEKANVPLVRMVAEYSNLQTLIVDWMRSLVGDSQFAYRFFLSKKSLLNLVPNTHARDVLTRENLPLLGSPLGFAYIFYPNSSESETVSIKFQMRQTALDHFIQRCSIESDENRRRLVDVLFSQAQQTQKDADSKAQIRAHALVIAAACVWGTIQDRQLQDCKKILQIIYLQSIIRTRVYQNNDAMQQICTPAMKFIDYYPNREIRSAMQKEKIYEIIKNNATGTTTNSVLATLSKFRHPEPTNSQSAPVISTNANTGK